VRFHGAGKVRRFLDDLLAAAKDEAPDCLVTYTNYPSTEFLSPDGLDFYCANVYLEDVEPLGRYLDRLQHVAGPLPLLLGECGVCALRRSAAGQAELLAGQLREVSRRGLAGSFVFSYTDDWHSGGHPIHGWGFGLTDAERREKPAADAVRLAWSAGSQPAMDAPLPKASVVVCSYNGAATLEECLRSLLALDYPDFEVILVDDGSTDETPAIARQLPAVRYIGQENRGLSAARNTGLLAATGDVVAYTDADCVAERTWLQYLVSTMCDQGLAAAGGPNVPPRSDGWVAQCVAASPGGPSHVMLDDRRAEHVPGCNMAFDRRRLIELGGFDEQFRVAGDDVDVCWRLLDAALEIGYAPAALVWHHRRGTVGAYFRQQRGYGRSEAMLQFKHPHRFTAVGAARWRGVIYGDGAVGLPVSDPPVYYGRFGTGPFQIIYRHNRYTAWAYFTLLEWHAAALLLLTLATAFPPLAIVAAAMWCLTCVAAARSAVGVRLPARARWWCRPLVVGLHMAQPVVRSLSRYRFWLRHRRGLSAAANAAIARAAAVAAADPNDPHSVAPKRITWRDADLYYQSDDGRGREHLLEALTAACRQAGCTGDWHAEWDAHDVELWPDAWHDVRIRTATEELGGPKRFTRIRWSLHATLLTRAMAVVSLLWLAAGLLGGSRVLLAAGAVGGIILLRGVLWSRARCRRDLASVIDHAAVTAGLKVPAPTEGRAATPTARQVPRDAGDGPLLDAGDPDEPEVAAC
jgi:glycosyltransferase involved in cell wall biosynthesis